METASVSPALDLFAEIARMKRQQNAVILAHYYQEPDIQDIADVIGDSLALAQAAEKTTADVIVFCGVHFMAETAAILNPGRLVLLPDLEAGCSLSDSCPAHEFERFVQAHPGHTVISYINCSAAVKALSDIICTSSNAVRVVGSVPAGTPIIFAPDQQLGRYVIEQTGRDMVLWPGSCSVHVLFSERHIVRLKVEHPDALVIAHPECEERVLTLADYIGSTTALLNYTKSSPAGRFIVATESGILHQMKKASPGKTFIPAPPDNGCACNECPYMRLNTLEKVYLCMRDRAPAVTLPEPLRVRAKVPLDRMLALSRG
ncbi:MAG: quinolinate synthase NadA [Vicinamibacterales bacterium]|jgi:quinolinate synthase|nr:quinolinate synthase NadA [Vicinamibacterales bacterium]